MIRILTLLVSLFTFGLVDLAEITYEIPVTDMLYFNDTPIEELNGLTLNEVFKDSQIIDNGDFTNNNLIWFGVLDPQLDIFNNNLNVIYSNSSSATGIRLDLDIRPNVLEAEKYYLNIRFKTDDITSNNVMSVVNTDNNFITPSFNLNKTNDFSNSSRIIEITTDSSFSYRFRLYSQNNSVITTSFDHIYMFNLTSLGIDTLTKEQLDLYFELWNNPELNITYEINELDTQDIVILIVSQSVWTIMIHLLYKYAYRPKKKSKRLGM